MKPFETRSVTGFYRDGEFVCTGATMGRANCIPPDIDTVRKVHVERVKPCDGGDYDKGGAYWGNLSGNPLFCIWGESETEVATLYVRAKDREQAKYEAKRRFANAKFYR